MVYREPGLSYSVDIIMEFQGEKHSEWWRQALFTEYPQIDRAKFDALPAGGQQDYLREVLSAVYNKEKPALDEKIIKYVEHWRRHRAQIEDAFSDAFGMDYGQRLNHMVGNISLNPICPRFLDTTTFDIYYLNSERGALGLAIHEMVHFAWFEVWRQLFADDPKDYETPHIKWVLSEMAVDPIMRKDARLHAIDPYFEGGTAYAYFYTMRVEGKPILETLYAIYTKSSMTAFMRQAYEYVAAHEAEIRAQML